MDNKIITVLWLGDYGWLTIPEMSESRDVFCSMNYDQRICIESALTETNWNTLPETNIAPENGWLEDYFPFGKAYFQGLCWF